jgi:hypothetical protein
MDVLIEMPKSRTTEGGKTTVEFTSKRKQFGSSENIYSYAKRGERERQRKREREMKKWCGVKHLSWQKLHNTRENAVLEWKQEEPSSNMFRLV